MRFLLLTLSLAMTLTTTAFADKEIPLWDGPAPQSLGNTPKDIPTITPFLPPKSSKPTPAVVICPGGAYVFLAFGHEGINVAQWYQKQGVAAFVLKYRYGTYHHPVPMLDAQRAMRLVRSRAADWNIDPAKVGIMGFSAGGHLASTVETHFDAGDPDATDPVDKLSCRPDFAVLVYPVISMKDDVTHKGSRDSLLTTHPDPKLIANLSNETQVTAQTPPTVIVVASDDKTVKPKNSHLMYEALQKAGVPSELQEYPTGDHGFGYGMVPDKSPPGWLDKVGGWLKGQGFMPDSYTPAPPPPAADASSAPAATDTK